jgi:VanZ family protein
VRRLAHALPAAAYAGLIFFLSSQSSFPVPARLWDFDKVLHAIEYGGLAVLCIHAARQWPARSPWVAGAILASLYGATDELHQSFTPGRSCDIFDWVADTTGAALAAFVFHRLARWRVKRVT